MTSSRRCTTKLLELGGLICILSLAAFLRLVNVTDNPGWYADEGTHLDIARNLANGRIQYLAITRSTLLFAKLPLFELLLAGLLRIWPAGMGTLRTLCGLLGVVSVATLFGVARHIVRDRAKLLAPLSAFLLAIYPDAVLYSRFGFSYNLLAPLAMLAYLGLWRYLRAQQDRPHGTGRSAWLALAAGAIGLGTISDLWMFSLVFVMVVVVVASRWRDLLWSLPLTLLPFAAYVAVMLARDPQAFLYDAQFTMSRLQGTTLATQVKTLALNYTRLVSTSWVALALVGLALLRPGRLRHLSLLVLLMPIAVIGRTAALFSLSYYYMIPLLPFIALGTASAVARGTPYLVESLRHGLVRLVGRGRDVDPGKARVHPLGWSSAVVAYSLTAMIVATPFLTSVAFTFGQVAGQYETSIDPFLPDPQDVRQTAAFVNARSEADDVVVASPAVAWLLTACAADSQMSVASLGLPTSHLPTGIPSDRFAYDPSFTRARYIVIDNLWHNWAAWHVEAVSDIMKVVELWPLEFQAGQISVYRNPGG